MRQATDKLTVGLEKLARADNDLEANGRALQLLHAALEDYFDAWLLAARLPPAEHEQIARQDWPARLDRMRRFGRLSQEHTRYIQHNNAIRNKVAHGDSFHLTHDNALAYADFVQQTIGTYPLQAAPPARPASRRAANKPEVLVHVIDDHPGYLPRLPRWLKLAVALVLLMSACSCGQQIVAQTQYLFGR